MSDEQTPYSYMTKGNEESITAWQERTWASEERIAELEQRVSKAEAQANYRKRCIGWLWDTGRIIDAHEPDCPEDDTCGCIVAQTIKKALDAK